MIIKSLSRATKSFEALYNYLTRDKNSKLNTFNLYSNPYQKQELIKEFLDNAKYLKNARGKNFLYHEIISLNKNNLSLQEQQNILSDLVTKYISLRARNHLTFTALHKDKEHIHIHLMISSNELMGTKRVRLSKKDFANIQKEIEQYTNSIYPQLGQTKHYNKDKKQFQNKKENLKSSLNDLFENSTSKENFKSKTEELKIEFYTRGKNVGVIFENKKYRLKTLELLEFYENTIERLNKINEKEKVNSKENETKIEDRKKQMQELRAKQKQSYNEKVKT